MEDPLGAFGLLGRWACGLRVLGLGFKASGLGFRG